MVACHVEGEVAWLDLLFWDLAKLAAYGFCFRQDYHYAPGTHRVVARNRLSTQKRNLVGPWLPARVLRRNSVCGTHAIWPMPPSGMPDFCSCPSLPPTKPKRQPNFFSGNYCGPDMETWQEQGSQPPLGRFTDPALGLSPWREALRPRVTDHARRQGRPG